MVLVSELDEVEESAALWNIKVSTSVNDHVELSLGMGTSVLKRLRVDRV